MAALSVSILVFNFKINNVCACMFSFEINSVCACWVLATSHTSSSGIWSQSRTAFSWRPRTNPSEDPGRNGCLLADSPIGGLSLRSLDKTGSEADPESSSSKACGPVLRNLDDAVPDWPAPQEDVADGDLWP